MDAQPRILVPFPRLRTCGERRQSIAALLLTLIVVLASLSSCTSTVGSHGATPTATRWVTPASSSATPAATITYGNPTPLTLAQAWGHPTIYTLPLALPDNRVFVFDNAVTPDNQWLIGADEPRDISNTGQRPSYLSIYNVLTGQLVHLRALLHPQSQILAASVDEHWIVWSEADDQPGFTDWTLFAYNRQTGQVRQLAQPVRSGGRPVVSPAPYPVVSAGYVIWSQSIEPVGPDTLDNAVVRMEILATGKVATLATRAGNPELAWPWALWGRFSSTGEMYGGGIILTNLSTGRTEQVSDQPGSIVLDGTSLAWGDITSSLTGSSGMLSLMNDFTEGTNVYTVLTSGSGLAFVTLNDRLVAWSQTGVTQVYDRAEQRLVELPITNGESETWAGYHTLVWPEPESQAQQEADISHNLIPAGTLNIIDTSTLPVQTGQ